MNSAPTSNRLLAPIVTLGGLSLRLLGEMGAILLFMLDGFRCIFVGSRQAAKIFRQTFIIGARSLFLIALISAFTGMVLGLQLYYVLLRFGAEGMIGAVVALALVLELGPVLTAIMITGRVGSAMAAEIGVMRITDQVDALTVMDINPMGYLVSPRIVACIISFPLLTAFFDVMGILGGYVTSVLMLGLNPGVYFDRIEMNVTWSDVSGGFIKSLAFGVLVAVICCYQGYFTHTRRDAIGPEAVSNATTDAVVYSCVIILIADYVLSSLLL